MTQRRCTSIHWPLYLLEHLFILVSGPHQLLNEAVREVPAQHVRHEEGRLLQGPADPGEARTVMEARGTPWPIDYPVTQTYILNETPEEITQATLSLWSPIKVKSQGWDLSHKTLY